MPTHTHNPAESNCAEMELLLQADLDGELDAAATARVATHIAQCVHCAALQKQLLELRQLLHTNSLRENPSESFNRNLRERLDMQSQHDSFAVFPPARRISNMTKNIGLLGAGAAFAASLLITLTPLDRALFANDSLLDSVVAEHVQSLQAEHLLDVASSDRHTVKPWFNGKLDYVPPAVDFSDEGFPLAGGRLAYLANRTVAALVYRRGPHPINVFVWPSDNNKTTSADCSQRSGYNVCAWRKDAMNYWAVSDMSQDEMQKFVALWK